MAEKGLSAEAHQADSILALKYKAGISTRQDEFWIETTLEYKNPDGSRGWIVKVRNGKKPTTK